jgi:hypothetical protein
MPLSDGCPRLEGSKILAEVLVSPAFLRIPGVL